MKTDSHYYIDGDKKYPRVTSVVSRWYDAEYPMATWVAKESVLLCEAVKNGEKIRKVESIWNGSRFEWAVIEKDPLELLSNERYLVGSASTRKQGAMDRGTLTNTFLDEYADGLRIIPDDVPEWVKHKFDEGKMIEGASRPVSWQADPDEVTLYICCAIKWTTERQPQLLHKQVFLKDEDPMYAGTADFIGVMDDNLNVIEIKTGSPNRCHAYQVAGGYAPIVEKEAGHAVIPRLVYFTKESDGTMRYMEKTIIEDRDECRSVFLNDLYNFNVARKGTPWNNVKSVRMEMSDFCFGARV